MPVIRRPCSCSQCGQSGHTRRSRQCPLNIRALNAVPVPEVPIVDLNLGPVDQARSQLDLLNEHIIRWEHMDIRIRDFIEIVPEIIKKACLYASEPLRQGEDLTDFLQEFKSSVIKVNVIIHRYGERRFCFSIKKALDGSIFLHDMNAVTAPVYSVVMHTSDYFKEVSLTLHLVSDHDISCECPLCFDQLPSTEAVFTGCNHPYCASCFKTLATSIKDKTVRPSCSLCRSEITQLSFGKVEICNEISQHFYNL